VILSNDRTLSVRQGGNGQILLQLEGPRGGGGEPARLSRAEAAELIAALANVLAAA
jgi:hypothetical protein